MKVFLDTDVLLDVALARAPHARDSIEVLRWVERGGSAAVAWHSLTSHSPVPAVSPATFLRRSTRAKPGER